MKEKLSAQTINQFVGLREQYWKTTIMKIQKQKRQKKCVIKRTLNFQYYENRLEVAQNENKTEHLEKKKLM